MVKCIGYLLYAVLTAIAFYGVAKNLELFKVSKKIDCINLFFLTTIIYSVLVLNFKQTVIFVILGLIILLLFNNKFTFGKGDILKCTITVVIIIICDNLVGVFLVYVVGVPYERLKYSEYATWYGSVATLIIIPIAMFLSLKVNKAYVSIKKKANNRNTDKIGANVIKLLAINTIVLIVVLIFSNITMTLQLFDEETVIKAYGVVNIIYFLVTLITSIVIVKISNENIKIVRKESELNSLVEYNSTLEALYSDMRDFKHDYLNILSTLSGYIDEKDYDGLEEYFNNSIVKYTEKMNNNNHRVGALRNLKVNSIKGLIFSKYIKAQENGINIEIDILDDIENINIEEIDFARCLGIILDNAIEGALESKEKRLELAIINGNKKIIVVVKNTTKEEIPPLYKLMEEGYSTKGENRGIGLSNFNQILSKYPNVNKDINVVGNEFIVTIECKE